MDGGDVQGDLRPRPDPTLLTTEQLNRGLLALRELIEAQVNELRTMISGHFRLDDERLSKIGEQLATIERVRLEQKSDTKRELDAALTAQKEAAQKTEASLNKLFEQITTTYNTGISALTGRVDDVRDRVVAIESGKQGASDQRVESRQSSTLTTTVVGVGVAIVVGLFAVIGFMSAHLK